MVFKKHKNALFHIAAELYNTAVIQNRSLKADEIKKAFKAAPYEPLDVDNFLQDFMQEDNGRIGFGLFIRSKDRFLPAVTTTIPAVLSHDEATWLKTMLDDETIDLFLDTKTQEKIGKAFAHSAPLYEKNDIYIQKNATQQNFCDDNFKKVFKTIVHSITEKKLVRFAYHTRKTTAPVTFTALPLKMYYHGVNNTFQCIAYDIGRKQKNTLNMERITNAELIDKPVPTITEMPVDKVEIARIELRNEKNIPAQCFMLLSDYRKTVVYDDASNLYRIAIQYYAFERQDLLKNLLSLGEYCTIISPAVLVEQIQARLTRLQSL